MFSLLMGRPEQERAMSCQKKAMIFTATIAMLLWPSSVSFAEIVKYKVNMKSSEEVPPADSSGWGTAAITYDTNSRKLSWVVTYSTLTGEPTAAHFHGPAAKGANAEPVIDISDHIKKGSAKLTKSQAADLKAGKWYLNIHTEKNPNGEIRGQVVR
jgi:hypothetical protein